jgi:glutathione S-transferase
MAEARQVIRAEAARVQDWNVVVRAKSGFAPGGWIAQLRRDVRRLHPKLIAEKTAELATRYDQLAGFVTPGGPYAMGNALTLADCVLFPLFFFATKLHPMLGDKDPTASRPALAKWWEAVQKHPAVAKVNAELAKALAEQLG